METKLHTWNFEIAKFKGLLQILNFECYFEYQYDEIDEILQYDDSIHAPD
jgi:hypothetical protein